MGAFYNYCKYNTRFITHLFYKNIKVIGTENLPKDKPVLLLPNHPNSFLDAVLVGGFSPRPTYFLARGDAFNSKIANPILKSLNMLPVYRLSEGKENLSKNTETFDACQDILEKKQMVLLFPEGLSENNWDFRTLKKGPPRISWKAWHSETEAKDLMVVPVGLTYEHYNGGQKNIFIQFGKPFGMDHFKDVQNEALFVKKFNEKVEEDLRNLAYIHEGMQENTEAYQSFRSRFQQAMNTSTPEKNVLKAMESFGSAPIKQFRFVQWSVLFYPLYAFAHWISPKIVKKRIFYDSICFGMFFFLWPVYLLVIGLCLKLIF